MKYVLMMLTMGAYLLTALAQVSPEQWLKQLIDQDAAFQRQEFYNPDRSFPSTTVADEQRRLTNYKQTLAQLQQLDVSRLSEEDQINLGLFRFVIEDRIAAIDFEAYLVPLNAEGGWFTEVMLQASGQQFAREEAARKYIQRLHDFKAYAAEQTRLMEIGLAKGRTAPLDILRGREDIVAPALNTNLADNPFYKPFLQLPASWSGALRDELQAEARRAITQSVIPAYRQFQDFWIKQYIPGAVRAPGISAQPRGRAYYEQRVRYFTTLPMTPEDVFETGVREVARIRAEMDDVLRELRYTGSFEKFLEFLRTDPQFYAATPRDLLKEASYYAKKIDGKLPQYFGKLPANPYGVSPVPEMLAPTYTSGRYSPGNADNHRAGFYWVNTYNLAARPLYALPALTLHEAVPGHHLQITLAQEMDELLPLRRQTYLSAFGEGWALYCEWLGKEMGIYETLYEQFGRLTYEMWRACRLVVDPGLHVKGWTRQQAIDFMASNTALSLHECTTEVDRYIGWPGQAVSYKIGELKIRELRAQAEQALGANFNLRDFHDLVLSKGSVPLFTLEKMVNDWVAARKSK
jgi:uncharacterized protein (DUF885 family)